MKTLFKGIHGSRPIIFLLGVLFFTCFISPLSAVAQEKINRSEFIQAFAQSQPGNPFLPKNHTQLSPTQLYDQTVKNLKDRGIKVLNGKNLNEPMTNLEFVRVVYALTGAPQGKSLFEQKVYLKKQGLLSTADIGLTTGLQGQALQFHKGDPSGYKVQLASPVYMYDKVKTENGSNISFTFDDGSSLTLSEDAQVRITKHVFNPDTGLRQTIVNVTFGMVRFVVSKAKGKGSFFKVITPTATADVLGTEFVTVVGPDGQTQFIGIKNQIETAPILPDGREGKKEIVRAGTMRTVDKNRVASAVSRVPPRLITSLQSKTSTPQKTSPNRAVSRKKVNKAVKSNWITQAALANEANFAKGAAKVATKSAAKIAARSAAKIAAKSAAKIAAKSAAKTAAKSAAKTAAKSAAKTAAKSVAKSTSREVARIAAKDLTRLAAKETAKSVAKDTVKGVAKDAAKGVAKNVAKGVAKGIAKNVAKNVAKGVAKDVAKDVAKSATKDATKSAAKDAAKNATKTAANNAKNDAKGNSGNAGGNGNSGGNGKKT